MKRTPKIVFRLFILITLLCFPTLSVAEIKVFEREVEEAVGRNQSQEAVEAFALQKAKRLAVEEAGTYISSFLVVERGRLTREQLTALAAGVVKTEIIGVPQISIKKGIVHVRVKAKIEVDTKILEEQVEALLRDKALLVRLEAEQKKVQELEEKLAGLKREELTRLEELNREAVALEIQREKERLEREERRLKAHGAMAKAELEILKKEQERMAEFATLQREQEEAREKELEAIAREEDRLKRVHLENERYWKELARKAELSRARWTSIDDTISLQRAVTEAEELKGEIAGINRRLDFMFRSSEENLKEAYRQQIAVTKLLLPPDPAPKDLFETTSEYQQRLDKHKEKVHEAVQEHEEKIESYKSEEDVAVAQLKVNALSQKLQILEPFIERLQDLQSTKFALTKEKGEELKVALGEPDADNYRFPLYLEYKGKKWVKFWPYTDRKRARAFWKTRSHLIAKGLFQLGDTDTGKVIFHLTAARVMHLGTNEIREFDLNEPPAAFEEIRQWKRIKTLKLPEAIAQEKIAAIIHEGGLRDPVPGMEFVVVKGGCYMMGCGSWSGDCDSEEKPAHEVCVGTFLIGKFEVTQGQWRKVMGNNPSYFKNCGDDCPVEMVSWYDTQEFIRRLNALNKGKRKYRLPTEAEWEYACRSGGRPDLYCGGNDIGRVAWYDRNSGRRTHPVGAKVPNGLGIYDMSGNVWEWCEDWYGGYPSGQVTDPKGPSEGSRRVIRGGGWNNSAGECCSVIRGGDNPVREYAIVGFRLARSE